MYVLSSLEHLVSAPGHWPGRLDDPSADPQSRIQAGYRGRPAGEPGYLPEPRLACSVLAHACSIDPVDPDPGHGLDLYCSALAVPGLATVLVSHERLIAVHPRT